MKQKLLNVLGAALIGVALGSPGAHALSYSSDLFPGGRLDTGWTPYNGNSYAEGWANDNDSKEKLTAIGATGGAYKAWDRGYAADAWLFSPAISVESGKTYTVSIYARTHKDSTSERESFKITVGNEATKSAQSTTLIEESSYLNKGDFEEFTAEYTADFTGDAYFGLNCYSAADQYAMYLTKFSVNEKEGQGGGEEPGGEEPGGDEEDEEVVLFYSEFFDNDYYTPDTQPTPTPVDGWVNINAASGDKTHSWWPAYSSETDQFAGTDATYGAYYKFHDYIDADAWLISPAFNLTAGKSYNISLWIRTANWYENFKITVAKEQTVEAQKAGTTLAFKENYRKLDYEKLECTFVPEESGTYYFGLNCYSEADNDRFYMTGFTLRGPKSTGGDEPGGDEPGEDSKVLCESVFFPGGEFDDANGWTRANYNNDANNWDNDIDSNIWGFFDPLGVSNGAQIITYSFNQSENSDAWMFSPAVTVEANKEYTVSIYARTEKTATDGETENFKVTVGKGADRDSQTQTLIIKENYENLGGFEQFTATFKPSESGEVYFGINCFSEPEMYTLYVTKFSVIEKEGEGGEEPGDDQDEEVVLLYSEFFDNKNNTNSPEPAPVEGWTNKNASTATNQTHSWWPDNKSTAEQLSVAGATYGAMYKYNEKYNADAWLISPGVKLSKDTEYTVSIWARTTSSYGETEKFKIMAATANDVASLKAGTKIIDRNGYINKGDFEQIIETFIPDADGTYYFGVNAYSAMYEDDFFLTGFKVVGPKGEGGDEPVEPEPEVKVPAAIEDFSVKADTEDKLEVITFWMYPDTSVDGEPLEAGDLVRAELYRDGTLVYTDENPGKEDMFGMYIDKVNAEGVYTYKVRLYGADDCYDEAHEMEVTSDYVGHPTMEMNVDIYNPIPELAAKFTFEDQNGDGSTWTYYNGSQWSRWFQNVLPEGKTVVNDYIGTPYVQLAAGYYKVTMKLSGSNHKYSIGLATNRHDLSSTFTELEGLTNNYGTVSGTIEIKEAGEYMLAVHHTGATMYSESAIDNTLKLNEIQLEPVIVLPKVASDLTVEGDLEKAVISWTNPSLNSLGTALSEITKVIVYRDNDAIATITDNDDNQLTPGARASYTDTDFGRGGKFTYKVEVYNAAGKAGQAAPSVKAFVGKGREPEFEEISDFNTWEIFHADGTSADWELDGSTGHMNFYSNSISTIEAYAATPHIYLEPGSLYEFTLKAYAKNDDATLEFMIGTDHSADVMQKLGDIALNNGDAAAHVFKFNTVDESNFTLDVPEDSQSVEVGNTVFAVKATTAKKDVYVSSYAMTRATPTLGIETVMAGSGALSYRDRTVHTSAQASAIAVYTLDGRTVASATNTDTLSLAHLEGGQTVVIVAVVDGAKHTLKVNL